MSFKSFVSSLNRVVQEASEKLGAAERTEYPTDFEDLLRRADTVVDVTERILNASEALLEPNPALRLESHFYDLVEQKRRSHPVAAEDFAAALRKAAHEIGDESPFGKQLALVAQTETSVAEVQREGIEAASAALLRPFKTFLETDAIALKRELGELDNRRLDLDIAKGKLKKARATLAEYESESKRDAHKIEGLMHNVQSAELKVDRKQTTFDQQLVRVCQMAEGVAKAHERHQESMRAFVEAQLAACRGSELHLSQLAADLGKL